MNETTVNLHYEILQYLYDEHMLPESCFSHIWEKFRSQNREIQSSAGENFYFFLFTSVDSQFRAFLDELKEMFWSQIIPNIAEYELLTDEMLNYFNHESLFLDVHDENFLRTLKCNEPKAGKDFVVYRSTDVDDADGITAGDEPLTTVARKTYLGGFGWDMALEDDTDGACIKVIAGQRAPEPEPEEDDSLDKVLSLVLTAALQLNAAKQYQKLTMDEMIRLLEDENDLTKPEDLNTLPRGLRKLLTNCKYFATSLDGSNVPEPIVTPRRSARPRAVHDISSSSNASDPFEEQQAGATAVTPKRPKRSTINIPNSSMSSDGFDPQHASSPMQSSGSPTMTPLNDVSNTPERQGQPRSKPSQERRHNTRMGMWMQSMSKNRKRARSSSSPEPEAKKVLQE